MTRKPRVSWNDSHEVYQASIGYEPLEYVCAQCGLKGPRSLLYGEEYPCYPHLVGVDSGWYEMKNPPPIPEAWL